MNESLSAPMKIGAPVSQVAAAFRSAAIRSPVLVAGRSLVGFAPGSRGPGCQPSSRLPPVGRPSQIWIGAIPNIWYHQHGNVFPLPVASALNFVEEKRGEEKNPLPNCFFPRQPIWARPLLDHALSCSRTRKALPFSQQLFFVQGIAAKGKPP